MRTGSGAWWLVLLAALAALSGCGQRGPLFLPEPPQAEQPANEEDEDDGDENDESP